jgi:uncharacterized YigZ family protein
MMNTSFRTIAGASEGLFKDKGSKFLAFAYPVREEAEAKEHIDALKKAYHDARHHCFAWRLDPDMEQYRTSDDGEPSGTAGKPILGQIQSRELTQVLVVVVRYFGGTKLGVSGLIQAYRQAAADALDQASMVEVKVCRKMRVDFPYLSMNGVMKIIKDHELSIGRQVFDTDCSLELDIWIRDLEVIGAKLAKIEGAKIIYL